MDAEDVLGPDHQDDPMTIEDAQLSDHKKGYQMRIVVQVVARK